MYPSYTFTYVFISRISRILKYVPKNALNSVKLRFLYFTVDWSFYKTKNSIDRKAM